ncbi:unnamed protein product [Cylicocyclus nassatus]|uniref:SET domain-containing protein n=1 Tax=Cylicocyclus nassatus TaxID=53992 RepID=A0AA36M4G6_CYLNA|nr:unnamed protein product [Cylicocyclus nassatus]
MDDYDEIPVDKNVSEEGRGEEDDDDEEGEDDGDDENEGNDGNDSARPFSRSGMFRRRLQRRTEGEETLRKRPRVSSPVKADTTEDSSLTLEEIVMEQGDIGALEPQASALESQASSPSPLKQFEQHPIGSSSGDGTSVQHIDIVDEQEAVEKIPVYKLKFHLKRQKSEACTANAELILSDSITMAVRRRVHVVRKSAVPASLLADLEKRTSYTGGLTEVENVWQLSNFIHRCHAQPVQDLPWLEVREMPTIKGRGVFAKVDIAVADYRGYRGLSEDVLKPYNKELDEEQRQKVAKYWMGVEGSDCNYIVLAHCDSHKATVTLGRLINQSIEHANLNMKCMYLGKRRVRWAHCLIASRDIQAGEQLLWNYAVRERDPSKPSSPKNFPCICHVCMRSGCSRRPDFDIGELLFLVTQKARAVELLLESTPAADPRVAFARSRRTIFTNRDVFPDPTMFLVKVASPLAQLLQIATEAAFKRMESVVLILYQKQNDPQPLSC